jgi:nitroreductase
MIALSYQPVHLTALGRVQAFRDTMAGRRSIRDFDSRPVAREIIDTALAAAVTAPSGANMQPWHFVVITDPVVKRSLREAAEAEEREFYARRATQEWLDALASLGTDWRKPFLETAPVVIAVFEVHRPRPYYAKESVAIATGFLLAALRHAGLATLTHTPSPMRFLNEILGRPPAERPHMLIPVGYPAAGARVPAITRKPISEVVTWVLSVGGIKNMGDVIVERPPALEGFVWTDEEVAAAGLEVTDAAFVTIGGGLASFAVVDMLRVCGVPADRIRVVSPHREPYDTLRYLLHASQVRDTDPLRSDSMSRIGNIWGFPSYAVSRALRSRSLGPLIRVLCEPVAAEFFTPTAAEVYADIDREAARIGWESMLVRGHAGSVRRRAGGGYFVVVGHELIRTENLHIGTGYSGVGYAPEVTEYRERHREYFRVVNAYDVHEHVYEALRRRGGTVIVRGGGITASRVLQRLLDERADIRILHLFRSYHGEPRGPWRFRRPAAEGWAFQAFNFPKAAGAGQLRKPLLRMSADERAAFIKSIGGATTAPRSAWRRQLRGPRKSGRYQAISSSALRIEPASSGRVRVVLDGNAAVEAEFVIDCTGMRFAPADDPLLSSLCGDFGAGVNALGGLGVGPHFEVTGASSGDGSVYASGVIARGGYLAPVDSLWGFSHSAMLICDHLAARGFCKRLGATRSLAGWVRWLLRRAP